MDRLIAELTAETEKAKSHGDEHGEADGHDDEHVGERGHGWTSTAKWISGGILALALLVALLLRKRSGNFAFKKINGDIA